MQIFSRTNLPGSIATKGFKQFLYSLTGFCSVCNLYPQVYQRAQQSLFPMMWMCVAVFLLWTLSGGCSEKVNTSELIDYTAADFYDKLHAGKMMFIFFEQQVSPTTSLFLVELEKSADALQDYGVLVGKVNCNKEPVHTYCTEELVLHSAILFRGGKEFLNFDLDTLFDINSIVSEVLFAILRDEVKYVHTDTDLLLMEKVARGKKDIVLGYVSSLGTQEHRALMETAYVYGSKYQFILITGGPVLKYLGVTEGSYSSRVWFLHCHNSGGFKATMKPERCPLTLMVKPLSTLSLHSFLQLMEAPVVSEVYDDPSSVQPAPFPYQETPQVFLFSQPATANLDLDTATNLAWRLRGLALVVLVHRENPAVKTLNEYNAAYKIPEKSSELKYLTLHNLDEVLELFTNQEKVVEEEQEEDFDFVLERENTFLDKLDDEIAAHVYENQYKMLDMDLITDLTSDSFHDTVAESSLTVLLFYLKWDAVSMSFFNSFIEVAEGLADFKVQMGAVNCGEWSDLCAAQSINSLPIPFQPITSFPTILLLRPKETAQHYRGMLDTEALHRFILMSLQVSPVLLSTQEEVTSFLQEVPYPEMTDHKTDRVLGLFKTQTHTGISVFKEAAKLLRGELLTGLLTDGLAENWAAEHSVDLPAVLVFPSWSTRTHTLSVPTSAEELLSHINTERLHSMPELTVENLPSFLSLGKALLLLFVGEEEDKIGHRQNEALVEEMSRLVESGGERMKPYLASWIHLGRTPAAMSVLGLYLGSMPPLPALVLTHLSSGNEIYQYPPNSPIVASSVLQWLQRIEDGAESPAGMLGEGSWSPTVEFYDFLAVMDMQQTLEGEEKVGTEEVNVKEEKVMESSSSAPSRENNHYTHSEL